MQCDGKGLVSVAGIQPSRALGEDYSDKYTPVWRHLHISLGTVWVIRTGVLAILLENPRTQSTAAGVKQLLCTVALSATSSGPRTTRPDINATSTPWYY